MKFLQTGLLFFIVLLSGCGGSGAKDQTKDNAEFDNPNEALYNEVMDIHDEVMPKMQNLYTLKKSLQDKMANPNLTEVEKTELQNRILRLDSVSQLMMDWMHKFEPLPDSADREEAREYLESEMEKIKKVREAMLETIEKEKGN
jgi:hypothetical protein